MSNTTPFCLGLIDTSLLVWAISQITIVAVVTYGLVVSMRRVTPGARVVVCGLGLLCMSLLPSVTMLRSAGWSWGEWIPDAASKSPAPVVPQLRSAGQVNVDSDVGQAAELEWWQRALLNSSQLLAKTEASKPSEPAIDKSKLQIDWLALFVVCGIALGAVRLAVGIFQVQMLRRSTVPLSCPEIDAEILACTRQLGVDQKIVVGVSKRVGTAAVVGWRRPMLLLPVNWRDWSDVERKTIFAHEVAHVRRADFLMTTLAQVAVAINFFHPLAHAIIARFRLNQELAADAMAANVIGGSQQYVEILASLALRQPMVRTPGPAQAFLPPRRMFVRRLEMLSNMKERGSGWSRLYTLLASGAVIAATVVATGLRPFEAKAQDNGKPLTQTGGLGTEEKDLVQLIPPTIIIGVIEVDVASLLAVPAIANLMNSREQEIQGLPFEPKSLDRMLIMMPVPGERPPLPEPLVLLRFKQATDLPKGDKAFPAAAVRQLDKRTLAIGGTESLRAAIGALPSDNFFASLLARHEQAPIRAAGRLSWINETMRREGPPVGHPVLAFAPLWEKVQTVSMGLEMNDNVLVNGFLDSDQPQDVSETLVALKVLAKNYMTQIVRDEKGNQRREPMQAIMLAAATTRATQLLNSVKVTANDNQVLVKAEMESGVIAIVETLLPAVQQSRKAAQRMQSSNNMKQLMLALHNYANAHADTFNRFPPAVIVDPETGVERSWRVEILPYLNEPQLYAQYRKDEPWDSEANMQVLSKMPAVFALPGDADKTQTPYQALVNEGGGLTPGADGQGPKFSEFTDGLSKTLVLVETLPMVPWTKPVDVSDVMAAREVSVRPSEGGFLVARGDGSVVFIANSIDQQVWQALTTRAGGEAVNVNYQP